MAENKKIIAILPAYNEGDKTVKVVEKFPFGVVDEIYLGVIPQNKNAVEFYKRLGFKTTGINKEAFYYKGETFDNIRMVLIRK